MKLLMMSIYRRLIEQFWQYWESKGLVSCMIEPIPNYDDRKTTPPDDPEAKGYCTICGHPFWEGDAIYTVDGCVCETCLKENYREFA